MRIKGKDFVHKEGRPIESVRVERIHTNIIFAKGPSVYITDTKRDMMCPSTHDIEMAIGKKLRE
jgi:hypothetical protein